MSGDLVVRRFTGGAFAQNAYLVSCAGGDEAVFVDPGAAVEEMLAAARDLRLDVEKILLTHGHVDHVEGVARAKRETNASIHLHRADAEIYSSAPAHGMLFGLGAIDTPPPVDNYLDDGARIAVGDCELEVRHSPGHSPGHVVFVADGLALVGDCVFAGSIGRTDLPGGDFQTLMSSIRERILSLPDETILHPGHGAQTTVGHERATNPFLAPDLGGSRFV